MQLKHLSLLLFALLLGNCQITRPQASKKASLELNFQLVLDSIYQAHPDATGIMVHVEAPDQKISWSGAVGYGDKNKKILAQVDQPAMIASNTKTYVSATMLRLVEEKKVRLDQSIGSLLTPKTKAKLAEDNYALDKITVAHLLSHTSGIFDYVNADEFFAQLRSDAKYRWQRDEQIALAIDKGEPLAAPGEKFSYADTNYSLLSEIIEGLTGKQYYTAMREVLNYKKHGLHATWFMSQEAKPKGVKPLVHQYIGAMNLDNYEVDPSFDLYGGGGIVATTKDLARFSQLLFEGKFFNDPKTLELIYTEIKTQDEQPSNYYFGLSKGEVAGKMAFGHGGFWGTVVHYVPDLNASVAVFILERDQRKLRKDVLDGIVGKM